MAGNGTILVGTVGQGVHRSSDSGQTWARASVGQGMHSDAVVRCLAPFSPRGTVFAGSDLGLYEGSENGTRWGLRDTPMNGHVVWSIAVGEDANHIVAGTGTPSRPRLFFSEDGGET